MSLQLRLLGGFRVEGSPKGAGRRFESQKVRALLAYLACHPDQAFTREQLAELLWPEEEGATARRNLRQALYSLRQGLGKRADDLVISDHNSLRLALGPRDFFDVREAEAAYRQGFPSGAEVVPAELSRVADLYTGDLLSGFTVHASVPFENWLITEQERFRDMAVQSLRALVDYFSTRGEYEPALDHCHRLLEVDPLSEEAHHELIRHYVLSGRRPRAMRHYEELEELLQRELGVEPSVKTRELYESIQADRLPAKSGGQPISFGPQSRAPFVPLVGREDALEALAASWHQARRNGCRLALVDGEAGVGKTRLGRTFLNQISSGHRATIVQGRCTESTPWCGGDPLSDILRGLWERSAGATAKADSGNLEARLVAAVRRSLGPSGASPANPLVFFLDDLQNSSAATCEAVGRLPDHFPDQPLWVLATLDLANLDADHPLRQLVEHPRVDRVELTRLDDDDFREVCDDMLSEPADRKSLALHTMQASEGLPLAMVEYLNGLCDQGLLVPVAQNHWRLASEPTHAVQATPEELTGQILDRVERLPASVGRLMALASVIGVTFDIELLQRAAREHIGVVEIGIQTMLEHWLIRHYARRWNEDPRERDLVLWIQGARRGTFEFAHPRIRDAVYRWLPESRRRPLHGLVARALAERHEPDSPGAPERVAYHFIQAGDGAAALPFLTRAAEEALTHGQHDTAAHLVEHGLEAIQSLSDPEAAEGRRHWETLRDRCDPVVSREARKAAKGRRKGAKGTAGDEASLPVV